MKLIPIGVGDAFSALHYSFCLALEHEGKRLLIDCPHPIRKMLKEASGKLEQTLDVPHFDAVVLTHLHADHCSGLEGWAYFRHFVMKERARVYAHPLVTERLWAGHLAAGMEQILPKVGAEFEAKSEADWFDLRPLDEAGAVDIGPFSVECRRTIHHIPTTAVRIRAGDRTIGISADTAFDPSLIEWLAEADLIVHETNFGVHTPYEDLAALPAELRAKMRLVHYPDQFDIAGSNIEVLREGVPVEV